MRPYELTLVVAPDVDEQEFNGVLDEVKGWVEAGNGKVVKKDVWGRKHLAYTIGAFNEGHYVVLTLELDPLAITTLERNLRLQQKVLRHLVVRGDQ